MNFKKENLTLAELGRVFGVSAKEVGRWLSESGLRTARGNPTYLACDEGFSEHRSNGSWGGNWVWHAERTVATLIEDGHRPASPPPGDLFAPSRLKGPFTCRTTESGTYEIIGEDGMPVVWTLGKGNAETLAKLMSLADQHGIFERAAASKPKPEPVTEPVEKEGFVIYSPL